MDCFTEGLISSVLAGLPSGRAAGPDGIFPEMFQHARHLLGPVLLPFFQLCLRSGLIRSSALYIRTKDLLTTLLTTVPLPYPICWEEPLNDVCFATISMVWMIDCVRLKVGSVPIVVDWIKCLFFMSFSPPTMMPIVCSLTSKLHMTLLILV